MVPSALVHSPVVNEQRLDSLMSGPQFSPALGSLLGQLAIGSGSTTRPPSDSTPGSGSRLVPTPSSAQEISRHRPIDESKQAKRIFSATPESFGHTSPRRRAVG